MELLLAAVIEQAVHDRRLAVTHHLIDEECNPTKGRRRDAAEITSGLRYFFVDGGLERLANEAGFHLPIKRIKEKSIERF